jgi:hypothetical protein
MATVEKNLDELLNILRTQDVMDFQVGDSKPKGEIAKGLAPNAHEIDEYLGMLVADEFAKWVKDSAGSINGATITVKGRIFPGYENKKRWERVRKFTAVMNAALVTIGVILGVIISVKQVVEMFSTPD